MADGDNIHVEVVYALKHDACLLVLDVPRGSTLREAISYSGILKRFPEIDLSINPVGVFSQPRKPDDIVQDGDRIEIYRPLQIDPKEARRLRADQKTGTTGGTRK